MNYIGFSVMSGVFLSECIPVELFHRADESDSFDEIDEWIGDHMIELFEHTDVSDVWELIEDAANVARKFGGKI